MMHASVHHPQARRDVLDIYEYLASEASQDVAERFLDELEQTCVWLADMPGVGRPREFRSPLLREIRSHSVRGFRNHLVFYTVEASPPRVIVLRVLHAARDLETEIAEWTP